MRVKEIDERHKRLISIINELISKLGTPAKKEDIEEKIKRIQAKGNDWLELYFEREKIANFPQILQICA